MRALRWHGRHDVRLDLVPDPVEPAPGEVTIRVAYCGLCGSDVHEYLDGPFQIPVGAPHPTTGLVAPLTLGHEISGYVHAVGAQVEGLSAGDLVVPNALLPCGRCEQCRRGAVQRCVALGHLGMSADGGLAEFVTVPADTVARVDPALPSRTACLAEPFAVAVHAVRAVGAGLPKTVGIVGAGSIGLAVAIVALSRGARPVLFDVNGARLEHARSMGFEALPAERRGGPFEVIFDCSGARSGPASALSMLSPGGTAVFAGLPTVATPLDTASLVLKEQRIIGAVGHTLDEDLRPALRVLTEYRELAAKLITACVPLERAVSDGLDVLAGGANGAHCKIVVEIGAPA